MDDKIKINFQNLSSAEEYISGFACVRVRVCAYDVCACVRVYACESVRNCGVRTYVCA